MNLSQQVRSGEDRKIVAWTNSLVLILVPPLERVYQVKLTKQYTNLRLYNENGRV